MASDDRTPPGPVAAIPAPPAAASADRPVQTETAGPGRERAAFLAELSREPWRFGFYYALRRLDSMQPERPRIGATARPADDPIRLGQQPSLRFAPTELAAMEWPSAGQSPRLLVYFLGLLGPNGPLPLHLTEYARERKRNAGDPTLARFLDTFHHRMLSLFYRAWAQAQPAVSFDRPDQDRFGSYLASLGGTGMPAFQGRDAMPDLAKRHFAGHLSCQTRHPEGLASIVGGLLGLPTRIQEFVGCWLTLPPDCRIRLGETPRTGALGQTVTLGSRVWDLQSKFRVRIGPLCLRDYASLLPGGTALPKVTSAVRNYAGDAIDWELSPVLAQSEIPPLRLGAGNRLGWTSWLASGPLGRDGDDLKLDPNLPRPKLAAPAG